MANPFGELADSKGLARGIREVTKDRPEGYRQLDVREWLAENIGVPLPAEAVALYHEETGSLVCIAPEKTMDLVESVFMGSSCGGAAIHVKLEATLATFEIPATTRIRGLRPDRVRSVAGNTWREIEYSMLLTRPGQRVIALRREGEESQTLEVLPESGNWSRPLATDESGTSIEVELSVGPNGEMIDLNYAFLRHSGHGARADRLETSGTIMLKDGTSAIVNLWPRTTVTDALGRNARLQQTALILRAQIVNMEGVPLREAFGARVRQMRALLEKDRDAPAIPGLSPAGTAAGGEKRK